MILLARDSTIPRALLASIAARCAERFSSMIVLTATYRSAREEMVGVCKAGSIFTTAFKSADGRSSSSPLYPGSHRALNHQMRSSIFCRFHGIDAGRPDCQMNRVCSATKSQTIRRLLARRERLSRSLDNGIGQLALTSVAPN